ncbi:MAG: PGF-pre-PGF domain-containing protein, partial [Nanoarchaeota archaeon]|nr:PGF-pre-PGF domain-containing protein [Nanoarchaeota archaeon]
IPVYDEIAEQAIGIIFTSSQITSSMNMISEYYPRLGNKYLVYANRAEWNYLGFNYAIECENLSTVISNPTNLAYYTCSQWNFTTRNCTSGWTKQGLIDLSYDELSLEFGSSSEYVEAVAFGKDDETPPSIIINTPAVNETLFNNDGNATINFTVTDNINISSIRAVVDFGRNNYTFNTTGNKSLNLTNLRGGMHKVTIWANDSTGNTADTTLFFRMIRQMNVTQVVSEIQTSLGLSLTSIEIDANNINVSGSESIGINTTMSINMVINSSGTNVRARIPQFSGMNANWGQTFSLDVNKTSLRARRINSNAGANLTHVVVFRNISSFLNEDYFETGAKITFDVNLGDLDVLFIEDDEGELIHRLDLCENNIEPNNVTTVAQACYTNTSVNVTLHIPHFSGGGLANDTEAPSINITYPISTANNSFFTAEFEVTEVNPLNNSFCHYNLTNNEGLVTNTNNTLNLIESSQSGTKYTYNVNFSNLTNRAYNFTVLCTDLNNQSSNETTSFTVIDSVQPEITTAEALGTKSSSTETSLTIELTATTNEKTICKYSSVLLDYDNESMSYLGSNSTVSFTHSKNVIYLQDESVEQYIKCRDENNQTSSTTMLTYTINVAETSETSNNGGGGGGSRATGTPTTMSSYSKVWAIINAGENKNMLITSEKIPFKKLSFKANNQLSQVTIRVNSLDNKPTTTTPLKYDVYKYIELIETNIDNTKITETEITFEVLKSWLTENSISKDNIALFRFVENEWQEQETFMISEDNDSVSYKALTTGFSYFAISQREEEVTPKISDEQGLTTTTGKAVAEDDEPYVDVSPIETKGLSALTIWTIIAALVIIILIGVFWKEGKIQKMLHMKEHGVDKPHENYDQLEAFIKKQLDAGHTAEEVKEALIKVGWLEEKVDELLTNYTKK